MTPDQLAAAAATVKAHCPGATLLRNTVHNLAIFGEGGAYVGYIDLNSGEVHWLTERTDDPNAVPDDIDHLVAELVALRRECGKSQAQIAESLGLNQSTISRIEDGRTDPTARTLAGYAAVCGRRLTWQVEELDS